MFNAVMKYAKSYVTTLLAPSVSALYLSLSVGRCEKELNLKWIDVSINAYNQHVCVLAHGTTLSASASRHQMGRLIMS